MWFIKITKVVPFESVEVFCKDPFLALYYSLSSLMIFLHLRLLPSAVLFTLTIWPFGPPPPRFPLRWRPHKELCFDWSAGLSTGVFLSIRANVRHPSCQWIPTKLTSSPTSSYSALASVLIPLQPFSGSPSTVLYLFLNMYSIFAECQFFPRLKALRCISASSWGPSKESLSVLYKIFSSVRFHLRFTRMVSFPKRYQFHQIGRPPPSGQSRHHRLPLVLPYPSTTHRDFFTSPTSHSDSFHSFFL